MILPRRSTCKFVIWLLATCQLLPLFLLDRYPTPISPTFVGNPYAGFWAEQVEGMAHHCVGFARLFSNHFVVIKTHNIRPFACPIQLIRRCPFVWWYYRSACAGQSQVIHVLTPASSVSRSLTLGPKHPPWTVAPRAAPIYHTWRVGAGVCHYCLN